MTPPYSDTTALRQAIIDACLEMNATGINQGTSGNISVRLGDRLLITPSGIPYDAMHPEMLVTLPLSDADGPVEGGTPSSEWRFHKALLATKPDMHAVIHAHPAYCTALAINRETIPPCHYMIAAFGGADVKVADYALYGSADLALHVKHAMENRHGCLMANHGAVVVGESLQRAMWRMGELEALAKSYVLSRSVGTPILLSEAQIEEARRAFAAYGPK